MSQASLRERKKNQVREAILDVSSRLIARHGFDGTSMRAVADAADVSHQTLYNYFPSKASLAAALLDREGQHIVHQIDELFKEPGLALLDRCRRAVPLIFARLDQDTQALWREVMAVSLRQPENFVPMFREFEALVGVIAGAATAGEVSDDVDAEIFARTLIGILDQAALTFIVGQYDSSDEGIRIVTRQLELVIVPYLRRH